MRFATCSRSVAVAIAVGASAPAAAFNCYEIVDRSNEIVYQDVTSPIDLSDAGTAARDALRARGAQLIAMDTDHCPAIDTAKISGKGGPATVEEIVAGMRPSMRYGAPTPAAASGGISLPRITVPRATGGGMSPAVPPSGMGMGISY